MIPDVVDEDDGSDVRENNGNSHAKNVLNVQTASNH